MSIQTPVRAPQQATRTQNQPRTDIGNLPTQQMDMRGGGHVHREMKPGTETKPALKSTELYVYLAAVAGVLIASQIVGRNSTGVDIFRADNAWFMITLLTIGYLVSRGLAKAGSAWRGGENRK
ncbi:hypothetical protein ACWDV4_21775 [Micromonospora sp. NPDC003197]